MESRLTAILRHATADGRSHHDWLLAAPNTANPTTALAECWRCPASIVTMPIDARMTLEALSPHRGAYLALDAPIDLSGGRGRVEPVARGLVEEVATGGPAATRRFTLRFHGHPAILVQLEGLLLTRVRAF
jgi:hypothetical protein